MFFATLFSLLLIKILLVDGKLTMCDMVSAESKGDQAFKWAHMAE